MSWKKRPLSAKWPSWRRISSSGEPPPRGRRSAPADSTNWMYGRRLSREISSERSIFLPTIGVIAPLSTVGSLPAITHSTPATTPMPVTNPPPTAKSVPQPASGLISRNGESRSRSSSTRSRIIILPRFRSRSTRRSPPPARASASCSSTSWSSALMPSRLARKLSEFGSMLVCQRSKINRFPGSRSCRGRSARVLCATRIVGAPFPRAQFAVPFARMGHGPAPTEARHPGRED